VQLYEAVLAFALVLAALFLAPRKRFAGETAASMALAYCAGRFVLELLRGDPERLRFGPAVPPGPAVGLLALALLGVWLVGTAGLLPPAAKRRAALIAVLALTAGTLVVALLVRAPASSLSTTQWLALCGTSALAVHWRRRPPTAAWSSSSIDP
jgi:hypothetical protein